MAGHKSRFITLPCSRISILAFQQSFQTSFRVEDWWFSVKRGQLDKDSIKMGKNNDVSNKASRSQSTCSLPPSAPQEALPLVHPHLRCKDIRLRQRHGYNLVCEMGLVWWCVMRLLYIIKDISPSNSDHQVYHMFGRGSLINLHFLPQLHTEPEVHLPSAHLLQNDVVWLILFATLGISFNGCTSQLLRQWLTEYKQRI